MDASALDKFNFPKVYVPTEDLHNTNHGRLPGSMRWGEYPPPDVSKEVYMKEREAKEAIAEAEAAKIAK